MGLLDLPNEILCQIADELEYFWDLNSLTRVNRFFHELLNPYLYYLNIEDEESSALGWAAKHGVASTARMMLEQDADTDALSYNQSKPMFIAAMEGHEDVVRVFLEMGFDTTPEDGWHESSIAECGLLMGALEHGHLATAKLLIEHGMDPNKWEDGVNCLHAAAMKGQSSAVKFLVEEMHCDPNLPDKKNSYTPLLHAVHSGSTDTVRCLLQSGVDPDFRMPHPKLQIKVPAIYFAATVAYYAGNPPNVDVVRCFIDHGVEPSPFMRPVCAALEKDDYETAGLLLEHTSVRELPTGESEQGILLCAAAACNSEPLVRRLLDSDCSPEARQAEGEKFFPLRGGWTALTWAARQGHENVAALLLERGANPGSKEWQLASPRPLVLAIRKGHGHMVKLLLEHGADPNRIPGGRSVAPLFEAIPHEGIFKTLLEHGADPSITDDSHGSTPLIVKVVMSGNTELVRVLLERGIELEISPNHRPPTGRYLLHPGVVGGAKMLEFMFEHGFETPDPESPEARYAVETALANDNAAALKVLFDKGFTRIAEGDQVAYFLRKAVLLLPEDTAENVLNVLISHGVDIDARGYNDRTCLWEMVTLGHSAGLKMLLDRGANIFAVDRHNDTSLSRAVQNNNIEGLKLLLPVFKSRVWAREDWSRELLKLEDMAVEELSYKAAKFLQHERVELAKSEN